MGEVDRTIRHRLLRHVARLAQRPGHEARTQASRLGAGDLHRAQRPDRRRHQSPFNVATPIVLDDFDLTQLQRLNTLHSGCLGATDLERLRNLLNGHPYLTLSALYDIATGRQSVEELFASALRTDPAGPFADHLGRYRRHLTEDPVLNEAMAIVITDRTRPQNLKDHRRLLWLGLTREAAEGAEPRNRLYEEFFTR